MKKLSRILTALLALSMLLSLATTTALAEDLLELEIYLNYSWWVVDKPFDETNEISKWIMENKGVKLNFTNPAGDPMERINIMIQTDTFPDIMMLDRDATAQKLVELGKIVRLDDYIAKYPGYKSVVDEETRQISSYAAGENNEAGVYNMLNWALNDEWQGFPAMFYINETIYEQLGSPSLETTDDFYEYLKAVKEADLTVNGLPVVPLQGDPDSAPAHVWLRSFDGGLSSKDLIDGRVVYEFTKPGTLEGLKFINKLYSEGLINKDCFSEQAEQVIEKALNGRAAIYMTFSPGSTVEVANANYANGEGDFHYTYSAKWPAPDGLEPSDVYSDSYSKLGWNALYITKDCEDPERAFAFLDWLITPEGQNTIYYGPKGILWDEVDEDQVPIFKEGANLNATDSLPLAKFEAIGNAVYLDFAKVKIQTNMEGAEVPEMTQWQCEAAQDPEVSRKKNVTALAGVTLSQDDPEFAIDEDIKNYILDQYAKILTGSPDDVEKLYYETVEGMEAKGSEKVEERLTAIYEERNNK